MWIHRDPQLPLSSIWGPDEGGSWQVTFPGPLNCSLFYTSGWVTHVLDLKSLYLRNRSRPVGFRWVITVFKSCWNVGVQPPLGTTQISWMTPCVVESTESLLSARRMLCTIKQADMFPVCLTSQHFFNSVLTPSCPFSLPKVKKLPRDRCYYKTESAVLFS